MPSLKEYNVKIASLKNTSKVTKTMKLVSSSKFRKAQDAQKNSKEYADNLKTVIGKLVSSGESDHPFLKEKQEVKKCLIVVLTSDKGLCGGFNNNMQKFLFNWIKENKETYDVIDLICCGKRGYNFFSKRVEGNVKHYEDYVTKVSFSDSIKIGNDVGEAFLNNHYDEVYLSYNIFKSALTQEPNIEKLLPVLPEKENIEASVNTDYIFQPNKTELLNLLIPKSVNFRIFNAFLQNAAGEHAARMNAMDSASSNASKLIDEFTLLRNRARQASITNELIEIVAGANAL